MKTVPWWAISSLPGLSRYAPVKLPLTWPNSSDSSSVSGRPAQLTATNSLFCRGPSAWMARATTSLPTPLSPVIRTFASDRATRMTSSRSSSISGLVPTSRGDSPTLIRMRSLSLGWRQFEEHFQGSPAAVVERQEHGTDFVLRSSGLTAAWPRPAHPDRTAQGLATQGRADRRGPPDFHGVRGREREPAQAQLLQMDRPGRRHREP